MYKEPRTPFSIVFDLDETLVSMVEDEDIELYKQRYEEGSAEYRSRCFTMSIRHSDTNKNIEKVYMIKRKGLDEFLQWAKYYFTNIMIWSAGISSYVGAINDQVFEKAGIYPMAVFSKNDCIKENNNRVKPLKKIISKTWKHNKKDKVFILEDRTESVIPVDKANMVLVDPFIPYWKKGKGFDDNMLSDVRRYFEAIYTLQITGILELRTKEKIARQSSVIRSIKISCPVENYKYLLQIGGTDIEGVS